MIKGVGGISEVSTNLGSANFSDGFNASTESINKTDSVVKQVQQSAQTKENDTTSSDNKNRQTQLNEENVNEMTENLNEFAKEMNYGIEFNYYKDLDRLVLKVVDKETKETIKQMPPEEMLDTLKNLREWIGVFLDKKA